MLKKTPFFVFRPGLLGPTSSAWGLPLFLAFCPWNRVMGVFPQVC